MHKPTLVFIGTYPPRECGIATFNQDLLHSSRKFLAPHIACKVAAVNHSPLDTYVYPAEVSWQINQNNKKEYADLARELNGNTYITGVTIQHEYGIYGGGEGENILSFIENCSKPILTTLHTVLPNPSIKMKDVTARIIRRSNIIVVLTKRSRTILEEIYPYSEGKVYVIPHGIHPTDFSSTDEAKRKLKLQDSTILSTFGLLSRGKGIEYVLHALPDVVKKYPFVKYLILGETHPAIRRKEGERYRLELSKLVTKLHLKKQVKFYDQYLNLTDLLEFLEATDIYISTSINPNQAVSGTLSYAMGMGRAVISTEFAQSKEIVTVATGRLVPIRNSPAFTQALLDLLKNDEELKTMHINAYDATRSMLWSNVAREYASLLFQVVLPPIQLTHLRKMTDDFGLFQFSTLNEPNYEFGYTLDDNARALVVCSKLVGLSAKPKGLDRLLSTYLAFIEYCQQPDGTFVNYIGAGNKLPTSQNQQEDISDAYGRALWAAAEVMNNAAIPGMLREKARHIFSQALPHAHQLAHLRSKAFVIKALALADQPFRDLADDLKNAYLINSDESWHWFEDHLGYNNGILSESMLMAGTILKDASLIDIGKKSLQFLIDKTFSTNMYLPIGHSQWYEKKGERSYFDQQPEDPASMISALSVAYAITDFDSYRNLANKCFSWFLGNNSLKIPLYNYRTGGCYDGLHPDRVNLNQGAESLVSYLSSRLIIGDLNFR